MKDVSRIIGGTTVHQTHYDPTSAMTSKSPIDLRLKNTLEASARQFSCQHIAHVLGGLAGHIR